MAAKISDKQTVEIDHYGSLPDGTDITRFTLRNHNGMQVRVMELGATLSSLTVPDASGNPVELTLGFDTLDDWYRDNHFMGAIVGRFANRIQQGRFDLEGNTHLLATNDTSAARACHLHGGTRGFNKTVWQGLVVQKPGATGVRFAYVSADGEEGYPGEVATRATYWLT